MMGFVVGWLVGSVLGLLLLEWLDTRERRQFSKDVADTMIEHQEWVRQVELERRRRAQEKAQG